MDVEYIPLETKDDFLTQGYVLDIGKEFIVVKNYNEDGNIFIYDKTGKAIRKINRKGQEGEEYTYVTHIIEMYVHSHFDRKIQVYDLYGKFKRSLQYSENTNGWAYIDIENYDKNNLICYDEDNGFEGYSKKNSFTLISKQNGSIIKKIEIPIKETKLLSKILINADQSGVMAKPDLYRNIIPFNGDKLLLELSSDTIYTFSSDHGLRPFMVRTPSVHSMNPETMLILRLLS